MIKNPLDLHISKKIRINRIMAGMSKTELSDLIGITSQQIKKYEDGTDRVHASRLYEIAQILETPLTSFFEDYVDDGYYNFENQSDKILQESSISRDQELKELIRIFTKIKDPQTKRQVINLISVITKIRP